MASKYCNECGCPFEFAASGPLVVDCPECRGQVANASSEATNYHVANYVTNEEVPKVTYRPQAPKSELAQDIGRAMAGQINTQGMSLQDSMLQDIQKAVQNASTLKPQTFKAEKIIGSSPNKNHVRSRRASGGKSAEEMLRRSAETKDHEVKG